jgi:hypothetical protein
VTGVDLILAALVAGAAAGSGDAAKAAVQDACAQLREVLRRRMAGRVRAQQVLDGVEPGPGTWQAELGAELVMSGAAGDGAVLAAARQVLGLVDPAGMAEGKYRVEVDHAQHLHVGDTSIDVANNQGAVGTFHAPISFGGQPVPPE